MAGASTSVYTFISVVSGQYEYKSAWTSLTDKTYKCIVWEENKCSKYIVNDQLFNIRIEDAYLSYISARNNSRTSDNFRWISDLVMFGQSRMQKETQNK